MRWNLKTVNNADLWLDSNQKRSITHHGSIEIKIRYSLSTQILCLLLVDYSLLITMILDSYISNPLTWNRPFMESFLYGTVDKMGTAERVKNWTVFCTGVWRNEYIVRNLRWLGHKVEGINKGHPCYKIIHIKWCKWDIICSYIIITLKFVKNLFIPPSPTDDGTLSHWVVKLSIDPGERLWWKWQKSSKRQNQEMKRKILSKWEHPNNTLQNPPLSYG